MSAAADVSVVAGRRAPLQTPFGRAIAFAAVAMAIVLALRLWLKWVGPIPGDRWALTRNDYGYQGDGILDVGNFFQAAGTPLPAAITIAWGVLFAWRSDGFRGAAFVGLAALGVVFNIGLKELSGPTPLMYEKSQGGLNYPSGHVVYATTVFGALAWLAWRHRQVAITAALAFLIALMGPFRVLIGAHMVSDVIAAYFVGLAWLVPVAVLCGYTALYAPPRDAARRAADAARPADGATAAD